MAWSFVCLSVRPSVRPSHFAALLKQCKLGSQNFYCGLPWDWWESSLSWQNFMPVGAGVSLERGRQRTPPPKKTLSSWARIVWKRLQIGTDMLLVVTSTGDRLFRFININDLELPWTPKKRFLVNFSQFLDAAHISTLNCNKMAVDRPRQPAYQIFSVQLDFSSPSPDPQIQGGRRRRASKTATPLKSGYFCRSYLV